MFQNRSRIGARASSARAQLKGGLAAIGSNVFWVEGGRTPGFTRLRSIRDIRQVDAGDGPRHENGALYRLAHDGTKIEAMAVSLNVPLAVAVLDGSVFVGCAGHSQNGYGDGAIVRVRVKTN